MFMFMMYICQYQLTIKKATQNENSNTQIIRKRHSNKYRF
jgi:hypothetical protein